ncbi:MAG: DUF5125 domain-containing protein [Mediterranea sp.]|jgi:hypothetical protein|nr:DUF5125 domain-containing protein [Mediterranea sp.]
MRKFFILLMTPMVIGLSSCDDQNDEFNDTGKATVLSLEGPESAYMGDSIAFTFKVASAGVSPSTSKVSILYGETVVTDRIVITGSDGTYSGRVYIPFLKDIPDGSATVQLRVQNQRYAHDVKEIGIAVTRPVFQKLILRTADGDYDMLPAPGDPHSYAVTDVFPTELSGYIVAPKYGANGNEITFGSVDGKISHGIQNNIEFTSDTEGEYTVSFNTLTYVGAPFIKFAVNDIEFEKITDSEFRIEAEFTQGEEIQVTGLKADYANYWIDPAFFDIKKNTDGKILKFRGMTAKYRFTVNKSLKYFNVELMNGDNLSTTNESTTGEAAIWVIGNNAIGKPSYARNNINWSPNKGFCMAPLGNKKHQVILKAGETINASSVNFKFFGQKDWGFEFTAARLSLITPNSWFKVNPGPSDSGNIMKNTDNLTAGNYYILTVDVSAGVNAATLSVEEKASIEPVD